MRNWAAGLWLILTLGIQPVFASDATSLELRVKATFLEKFGDFVTWPQAAFDATGDAFNICIYGTDPFGSIIDKLMLDNRSGGRPISVHRIHSIADIDACHILYLGPSEGQPQANVLRAVRGKPILTVTDERNNGTAHGIIHFVLEDNHVRFAIDDDSAAVNGLILSSKLLGIATTVYARRKEGAP